MAATAVLLALLAALIAGPTFAGDGEEEAELRERLTEREDRRRTPDPFTVDVGGHPLTIEGEYEVSFGYDRRLRFDEEGRKDRLRLEQTLDVELFYTLGKPLSIFAQASVEHVEDLLSDTPDRESDLFVERGEMWLVSEEIFGLPLNFEIGRLDFEDERRWWWNEELDAVRLELEGEDWDVAFALAREIAPTRTGMSFIDPENDEVVRWLVEIGWEWRENHALELFALHQDDHSTTEQVGKIVDFEREDDTDARLSWIGARLMGVVELPSSGILGYWLDAGYVRGRERRLEYEAISRSRSEVESRFRQDVRGWAFDLGVNWILPLAYEPRLFAGYAMGSGDRTPDEGTDRSYQQTRLQSNEAGFGGVERFPNYGVLLDPELSNLQIVTVGTGFTVLRASSLDFVYHHYRLVEPATELRDARIEAELDGRSRDIGHGFDIELALEEWERVEFEARASTFRAGHAFGDDRGRWSYGAFLAMRVAF